MRHAPDLTSCTSAHLKLTFTRAFAWLATLMVLALSSCGPHRRAPVASTQPSAAPDAADALRARAEELWAARLQEDWKTVFRYERAGQDDVSEADFIAWSQEHSPFRVHSYSLSRVLTDNDFGWIEVQSSSSVRRFAHAPPQDVTRWEKWRRVDGLWYPVPANEQEYYPTSPALRDLDEEPRMMNRYQQSWEAREAANWHRLYELTDPRDRDGVPEEEFARVESMFAYLSHKVQWAEVIGNRATVCVEYYHKLTDPSLTKMPARRLEVQERWVKHENEWYFDLKQQQ